MGLNLDDLPKPLTAEQKANMKAKKDRISAIMTVYWKEHGWPGDHAAFTQCLQLYPQLWPDKNADEP